MEDRSSSRLSEWLDNLARESWQLELLISGFAIFLLIGIYEPLQGLGLSIQKLNLSWSMQSTLGIPFAIAIAAWFILLINLCVHVLFRGLWISAVGLRSVSDDIDFEALRLQPRFHQFLQGRMGSFDRYIERLEKICSVLFAFTFLILFMLLALGGMIIFVTLVYLFLREWLGLGNHLLVEVFNFALILSGLLYFVDFVTLAYLKRVRWLAPFYYPIYRFFSLITFARLYRPLYYNLIDNRFGRRVGFLLVPYILALMVLSSVTYITDPYFPDSPKAPLSLDSNYYDDLREKDAYFEGPSIPSRFIDKGFIELFLPYRPKGDDEVILANCPGLETSKIAGLTLAGVINFQATKSGVDIDSILLCMGNIHRPFVDDSLFLHPAFRFYTHPQRKDNGLFAMLDVQYLPRGEHLLRVETQRMRKDSLVWEEFAYIPFWKE